MAVTSGQFEKFARTKTVLLTTYRRDGTPVGTPVSIVVDGSRAFFRTYDRAWKTKRLRNNPQVEVAPSTSRGKPVGPAMRARAVPAAPSDTARARHPLARKYPVLHGMVVPMIHRLRGYRTLHYELIAQQAAADVP